jgi:hypothetical protein
MGAKMQHCFWCGAELGIYEHYRGDIEACSQPECQREMRAAYRAEEEERQYRAERDHFERY